MNMKRIEVTGSQGAGLLPPLNHLTMAIIIPLSSLPLLPPLLILLDHTYKLNSHALLRGLVLVFHKEYRLLTLLDGELRHLHARPEHIAVRRGVAAKFWERIPQFFSRPFSIS